MMFLQRHKKIKLNKTTNSPKLKKKVSWKVPLKSTSVAVMGKRAEGLKDLRSPDEWEIVESIGEGTYGEVFKVRNSSSDQVAAAKVIDSILEKIEEVLPELEILKKYSDHPNVAGFFGAYIKRDQKRQDQLWLVMELCRGGSVTNLARNLVSKGKALEEDLIAYILYETLKGIEYLHRNCVMHRDIKGQNVMLTNDAEIRLIDFGVSAQLANVKTRRNSSVGTPFWMAPEVIACEQQLEYNYDLRCDIWSLGITAIELADGRSPLSEEHPMRALFKIPRSKPPTMKNPEKWSHEYRDFVAKCLVKDFEQRSYSKELLEHPFLSWVPTKHDSLRRKLRGVMDSQYHGKDGIMDEVKREKESSQGRVLTTEGPYVKPNARRNKEMLLVDDLTTLPSLTDEIILSHLLERFLGQQIYTYIGDILIAVNPLQSLNIYTKKHSEAYRHVDKNAMPPHIFMVADMTYRAMIHNQAPQCCLISGESGAGKTVSANFLVQQLAELGKGGNKTLEEKILQVNPLMEALGNARTVINENSSRFGKYLELHFTSNGSLIGASLTEYLLEKSRVVFQSAGERNFHIFYYMIAGLANQKKLEKYSFKLYSQHSYLQTGGKNLQDVVCTMGNKKRFEEVQRCLDIIGFSTEEVSSMFSVLAAIIHIGDIVFTEDESVSHLSDKSMVNNPNMLVTVSSLLELNAVELRDALTTNSNVTRGETIVRNNTVEQAVDCRDAMAKALYGRLFSWIVKRINTLLKFYSDPVNKDNEYRIGILDIFGFENFKTNSFEQLCINIANEQVQFYFNQQIFSWEQEEYKIEGVDLSMIKFEDNRPVLDMFLQKPIGILALLDEESRFPRATDFTLVEKFNNNIQSRHYQKPKDKSNVPGFCILHYAGKVKYDATNFLEKNRDTLSPDVVHVLRTSENKLVRTLIQLQPSKQDLNTKRDSALFGSSGAAQKTKIQVISRQGSDARSNSSSTGRLNQTVSIHFRSSLKDLLSKLLPSQSHFVRCIRPNESMIPGRFDQEKVMSQLKYTGVLETTRIRKEGYSERPSFEEFTKRYHMIGYPGHEKVEPSAASCEVILRAARIDKYIIGKTKVFMKYYHVERLTQLLEAHRARVVMVQSVIRVWLAKRRYKRMVQDRSDAALHIQSVFRGHLARQVYRKERDRRRLEEEERMRKQMFLKKLLQKKREDDEKKALAHRHAQATKIQAVFRGYLVRKNKDQIKKEQTIYKRKGEEDKRNRSAVIIQSHYRGYQARKLYQKKKAKEDSSDVKTIYFLQQIMDSCSDFYDLQQHTGLSNSKRSKKKTFVINELSQSGRTDSVVIPKASDELELASQQETKRIYLTQQIESSLSTFLDRLHLHIDKSPTEAELKMSEVKNARNKFRDIVRTKFSITPPEVRQAEMNRIASHRGQRSFRKEIWSAGDETYLRSFADDDVQEDYQKSRSRRISDMLSIVEGLPSDSRNDPDWLVDFNNNSPSHRIFPFKRSKSPPPINVFDGKTSENISQSRLRAVPPHARRRQEQPKQEEARPFTTLRHIERQPPIESAPPPTQFVRPERKTSETVREKTPTLEPVVIPLTRKKTPPVKLFVEPKRDPSPERPPLVRVQQKVRNQPMVKPAPKQASVEAPQINGVVLRKTSSQERGPYRRPEPKNVKLKHVPNGIKNENTNELYSHALRKTGRRSALGVPDDDGDSKVTRIMFNVSLEAAS